MIKLTAVFLILTVVSSTFAAPVVAPENPTITLSETTLCIFLPRSFGASDIGASESDAIPFCNTASDPNAREVNIIPDGFIQKATFESGDGYVQYTGTIDRTKYGLSPTDGGGQYDSVGAPVGATCAGFDKFVNLIEPDNNLFCIRCCTDTSKCDTGHSELGCHNIIPGQY